jgi:chemotaxis protein CheD
MNHFVLPNDPKQSRDPRYGNVAMAQLLAAFRKFGCHPCDLQAKVFGGADVLPTMYGNSVGDNNIRFALDLLHEEGIPVVAQRTGGHLGRKIVFNTAMGEVLVRVLTQTLTVTGPGRVRRAV